MDMVFNSVSPLPPVSLLACNCKQWNGMLQYQTCRVTVHCASFISVLWVGVCRYCDLLKYATVSVKRGQNMHWKQPWHKNNVEIRKYLQASKYFISLSWHLLHFTVGRTSDCDHKASDPVSDFSMSLTLAQDEQETPNWKWNFTTTGN